MILPGVKKLSLPARGFLGSQRPEDRRSGGAIVLKSTVVDTGNGLARTTLIRPGFVVGKKSSDGLFYRADDTSNVTGPTAATVTSAADIGAGAASKTFKWKYKGGGEQTVTMGGADDTPAEVVTKLNGDENFNADLIASLNGNKLVITARRGGVSEYFQITTGTLNGQGGSTDDTFTDNAMYGGSDPDYRVTGTGDGGYADYVDMLGSDGAAANQYTPNLVAGVFKESQLIGLTAEAKAVLTARGSIFV